MIVYNGAVVTCAHSSVLTLWQQHGPRGGEGYRVWVRGVGFYGNLDLFDDDDGFFIDNISINNLVQCAMCTPKLAMRRSEGMMLNMST